MTTRFHAIDVGFQDMGGGNRTIIKTISYNFATDIREGSAALSSWRVSYDNDGSWVYDYIGAAGVSIRNVQISGTEISCDVEIELYSKETRDISASRATVLFIADCE